MGVATVAVYSDADVRSAHVLSTDEAVHIGPAPARESYLNIERIIEAARRTGADGIHPGYGFLSENADFAEACEAAGIKFIGPSADAIRKMGSKQIARRMISNAGVPVAPGYDGGDQSLGVLCEKAREIGLPVLIKASAGGGGKGMRVIRDASELEDSIEAARREAEKAFGDGILLIEKYVDNARHVEVQILGDTHGNLIHLFERECSIQRRHQKIIEESPSPCLNAALRERICKSAVAVARAISYTNAGTVEFILAPSGEFYFIEVNTRLQVEHPVTEMTTGLDLVKLQIEIAEGKPLSMAQEHVTQHGHAIEARLYAEAPNNNFLPAIGMIQQWDTGSPVEGVRIDTGVERGVQVGIHYDPLLAKLIAYGADRQTALRKLIYALNHLVAAGVQTNREFLIRVLEHPDFCSGPYDTSFVDEHLTELIKEDTGQDFLFAGVVALYLHKQRQNEAAVLPHLPPSYRNNPYRNPSVKLNVDDKLFDISWRRIGNNTFEVYCGDSQANIEIVSFEPAGIRVTIDGLQRSFRIAEVGNQFYVQCSSASRIVNRPSRYPRKQTASEHESAFAPMPGQVLRVLVDVGQHISAGDPLVILEAMKMEQTLRASADGIVEAVLVKQGDVVAPGETLVKIGALSREE
jgi:acetyl/propionyl-CoA carboxylase alpha subunit